MAIALNAMCWNQGRAGKVFSELDRIAAAH